MDERPELMSGLDRLRSGLASTGAKVPFAELIGIKLLEVDAGRATRAALVPEWMDALAARCPAAPATVIADATLGNAVLSLLPAGRIMVSAQLRVDVMAIAAGPTGLVTCVGRCVDLGPELGLAVGDVTGPDGALLARASLWAAIVDAPKPASGSMTSTPAPSATGSPPGHHGADILAVEEVRSSPGSAVVSARPPTHLTNSLGNLHGGALGLLAEVAASEAVHTVFAPDENLMPFQLTVDYLKATSVAGLVEFQAHVVHRTRRFALTHVDVVDPTGSLTAQVRVSYHLTG